jgi:hypothetical protein
MLRRLCARSESVLAPILASASYLSYYCSNRLLQHEACEVYIVHSNIVHSRLSSSCCTATAALVLVLSGSGLSQRALLPTSDS